MAHRAGVMAVVLLAGCAAAAGEPDPGPRPWTDAEVHERLAGLALGIGVFHEQAWPGGHFLLRASAGGTWELYTLEGGTLARDTLPADPAAFRALARRIARHRFFEHSVERPTGGHWTHSDNWTYRYAIPGTCALLYYSRPAFYDVRRSGGAPAGLSAADSAALDRDLRAIEDAVFEIVFLMRWGRDSAYAGEPWAAVYDRVMTCG